jgi:ATP-dependent DNA helicase RecG
MSSPPEPIPLAADTPIDTLAESIAALANTRGGGEILLAGGPDADPSAAVDRALDAILRITPRLIVPLPETVSADGKALVRVRVPPGMPQVYAVNGRYLRRDGAQVVPMDARELRRLLIERGEITFETEKVSGATRDDLDWAKARAYALRVSAPDVEALLVKRGCALIESGTLYPTHAGLLLFGGDVQSRLRGAEITAVRFAGATMGDVFTRQDIGGTLPEQIQKAETFLRDHLRKGVALTESMARDEQLEYPLEAVRELVVNAVAHRDYSIQGDGIRLYIFKDRLEITSPGLLPGPVTIDNIKDERFSRNPALVQVLADMGYIERLGYGIDRVLELVRQHGLRTPQFSETGGGVRVTLFATAAEPVPVVPPAPTPATVSAAPPPPPDPAAILDRYRDIALNPRQETAITALHTPGTTRITNSELQRMFPDVHPETIRRDLSDLVSKEIFAKMGEKRGSYYVLKKD